MAFEVFKEQSFSRKSIALIERANIFIEKYQAEGYMLSIRQLYYQMVTENYIPNIPSAYKAFARLCQNARLAGLMDWAAIEDRGRYLREIANYEDPTDFMSTIFKQYAENLWRDQSVYVEVWVEKDAIVGVVQRPCSFYRVPFFSCRGYSSVTGMYEAGLRLREKLEEGKRAVIIYAGDHDPSGLDISRDNDDRLNMFARSVAGVEIKRVALTVEQINQYKPPPNPAKETDTRAYDYINQFGRSSWELDALKPDVLDAIVRKEIEALIDQPRFMLARFAETENDNKLKMLIDKYGTIEKWFEQIRRREN